MSDWMTAPATNERPVSAAQQRAEEASADDLAYQAEQAYQRLLNEACAAIRACPSDQLDRAFIAQVIYTLSSKASECGLEKIVVEVLDEAATEIE
jgi:hypothetical protein